MIKVREKLVISILILFFGMLSINLPERIEKSKSYMILIHYFVEKNI